MVELVLVKDVLVNSPDFQEVIEDMLMDEHVGTEIRDELDMQETITYTLQNETLYGCLVDGRVVGLASTHAAYGGTALTIFIRSTMRGKGIGYRFTALLMKEKLFNYWYASPHNQSSINLAIKLGLVSKLHKGTRVFTVQE